ncbi:MAG: hypothetical protein ACK4GL_01735 [Flavobacteriales bacterium]
MKDIHNINKKFEAGDGDYQRSPFQVPDGYFEEMPSRIQNRLQLSIEKDTNAHLYILKPMFAAAVSLIILVLGFQLFINKDDFNSDPFQQHLSLEYYLDFDESDEAELASAFYYALLDDETPSYLAVHQDENDEWMNLIDEELGWELYDYQ